MENTSSSWLYKMRGAVVVEFVCALHKGFNESLSGDGPTKARTTWDTPGVRTSFFFFLHLSMRDGH
jgi:hypothetical protein